MVTVLTRKTSELTDTDLLPPNNKTFRTSAVTVLLCYFTYLHAMNLKLRFLYLLGLCTNIAVKMTKVVIKILQGSALTETA